MQRSLKEKAIKIRGKSYVLVSDRVVFFNEHFPNGCITTELVTDPVSKYIIVKARVLPDVAKPGRFYTGYSQTVIGQGFINEVSALENAETSAVGRALAFMGIGVIDGIASANEIEKAEGSRAPQATSGGVKPFPTYGNVARPVGGASPAQKPPVAPNVQDAPRQGYEDLENFE